MAKYNCPRCDKGLNTNEIAEGQCACGLQFTISKRTDAALFDENKLMERLAEEIVTGKVPRADYYEKAIELLKGYLQSVVCARFSGSCTFYVVKEQEITCFLFRILQRKQSVYLEFDTTFRGIDDVLAYDTQQRGAWRKRKVKAYMNTRSLERAMEMALYVYTKKCKRYGVGKFEKNLRI